MRFTLAVLALLLFLSPPAFAKAEKPLPEISVIETYLNSLKTLRAHFVQTGSDDSQAEGTFLLKRPGRMRFDYAPPLTDFIVADGTFVYYYDGEMQQQSNAPINQSLANFFLREQLTLAGDLSVSDLKRADGFLQMTLTQTNDPLAGSLTLLFSEQPLQLQQWRVVDTQGLITTVALDGVENGITLNSTLFHYYPPDQKKPLLNK